MKAISAMLVLLVLFGFPFGAASFFEWSFFPGEWSRWTRLALAAVYAGYFLILLLVGADEVSVWRSRRSVLHNIK